MMNCIQDRTNTSAMLIIPVHMHAFKYLSSMSLFDIYKNKIFRRNHLFHIHHIKVLTLTSIFTTFSSLKRIFSALSRKHIFLLLPLQA